MNVLRKNLVMDLEIIDNFLPDYQFSQIQNIMMGPDFPWYYNDGIIKPDHPRGSYQFIHRFFTVRDSNPVKSGAFSLFEFCIGKLNARSLIRIKANLRPRTIFHRKSGYHTDFPENGTHKTAIFYINTNNGWTYFKKKGKVKSVANRMVIFNSDIEHYGVSCTDTKTRVLVNFNYE